MLTPRESLVRKLYNSQAQPFVRVVHGLPAFWDSNIAAATPRSRSELVVWSPCNRLVAITGLAGGVVILDAATLQQLQSLEFSQQSSLPRRALAFSPDSRMLTSFIHCGPFQPARGIVVSWDLQTGGIVSAIECNSLSDTGMEDACIVYSMGGRLVAALSRYRSSTVISIYDIVSGVHMRDVHHRTHTKQDLRNPYVFKIWTHGGPLRFATLESKGIAIWEVGLTQGAIPTEVETVPFPDDAAQTVIFESGEQTNIPTTEFHPPSCRLAYIHSGTERTLLVWDASASRFMLHYTSIDSSAPHMTFSSDGSFFACTTVGSEVCLWKESPAGYTLLEKFAPATPFPHPSLSPNGESIVISGYTMVQLWHTKRFTTSYSSGPLFKPLKFIGAGFILEFPPGRPFAVTARREDQMVTVLDLNSGVPQLTINTSINVYGFRLIGNTFVVIGDKKTITWNLLGKGLHPGTRMDINDSIRTINFGSEYNSTFAATLSPDHRFVALKRHMPLEKAKRLDYLDVYCTLTGKHFHAEAWYGSDLWFTPCYQIWCPHSSMGKVNVFTITRDALYRTTSDIDIEDGAWRSPWGSFRGYKVVEDGWIIGVGGKRLLMLPPL